MSNRLLAGRYELIEKIGEGGMAVVYKAKCRLLNRYVAIKILRPEYTKDSQFVESFKRESQAAASLSHPNIVSVYDVGKEGNINYIVMELIEGRPLSEIIKEQAPMDYRKAIEVIKQVAAALSIAHKNHIIHRDVKPHNILITNDGIAKLTDFGIAKAARDATIVTGTSKIIGSVHYFSPEQARGSYVDERSDIYSLGIVLYEMLTGQVPFDGDNPVSIALMHINDQITPPSQLVPGIPPALEKLIMKATNKYQTNRYKSADELLEELDNIEFVTKVVGNSVFAAAEDMRRQNQELDDLEEITSVKNTAKNKLKPNFNDKKQQIQKEEPVREGKDKKKKKILIFSIVGGIIALAILGFTLHSLGIFGGGDEVIVPDLKNLTFEEAEKELAKLELKIEKGDEVDSPDVEEGKITSQTPSADTKVKKGKTIVVNISKGKKAGVIPNVVSQDFEGIKEYIESLGFTLGFVEKKESELPKGTIISQSPLGGDPAEPGTAIDIVVSNGKTEKEFTVPTLTGLTVDEAKNAIVEAGFSVGKITYGDSTAYAKNYVMWQEYGANTTLKEGTKISIKVSRGAPVVDPEPEPEPDTPDNGGGDTGEDE
ncbi:MAG: Stk1 family PASTA domain-containing Ser/Thr kinase [Eubacteriales bacterium]|nr:Stk1 family PASTA domain-containing Ser/Thr kinase [Eubacteriales bacterium]